MPRPGIRGQSIRVMVSIKNINKMEKVIGYRISHNFDEVLEKILHNIKEQM